jgi:hypothetical protein
MGLAAWSSMIQGYQDRDEGIRRMKKLDAQGRPTYEIPSHIYANLSTAQRFALAGIPEEQKKQFVENIERGLSTGLNQISQRGGTGITNLFQAQADQYRGLLGQDAAARMGNIQGLMQQRGIMAGQEAQQYQINELQPYLEEKQFAQGLKFRGEDKIQAGWAEQHENIEAMIGSMTGAGMMGGGGMGSGENITTGSQITAPMGSGGGMTNVSGVNYGTYGPNYGIPQSQGPWVNRGPYQY